MATATVNYASAASITLTQTSLTNGSIRQSAVVDNTTNKYLDALVSGSVQTGTTPTVGQTLDIWAYGYDGTRYSGGASGSDASYTDAGNLDEMTYVATITVTATSNVDYVWGPVALARRFGGVLPQKWGIVIKNNTGVTSNATGTNNAVTYVGVKYDSA